MGGWHSAFTVHELEDYQELTFLTKKEILHVYKIFSQLEPEAVTADRNAKVAESKIIELPELKVNPFRERICKVFSSSHDGQLSFEDFLEMIDKNDLNKVITRLTGVQVLESIDMDQLINNILDEADIDDDQALSLAEFERVISKAPDVVNSFRIHSDGRRLISTAV